MKKFVKLSYWSVAMGLMFAVVEVSGQRDYTFTGNDGSNPTSFFSTANWECSPPDPGCTFPGPDDTARIGRVIAGGYAVFGPRALGAGSVKNLFILNGSTLNFTNFTTTQTFLLGDLPTSAARLESLVSGSVFNNNGTMSILSQASNSIFAGNFNFINNGTVNSWNLIMVNGPTITNQPNASFFIHATNGFGIGGNGSYTFNNLGFLNKPSSLGTAIISQVQFINSGTVEVGSGILQIGGAASSITSNCGRFSTTAPSAVLLLLAAMTVNPCPPPLAPPGDVATNLFGPGPIRIQSNITFNAANMRFGFSHPTSGAITRGNVELDGASILGNGNLRIVADANNQTIFTWLNGQIGGTGSFDIDPGGIVNINPPSFGSVDLNGRAVNNSGLIIWTGGGISNSGTPYTFTNLFGGIFEARAGTNMLSNASFFNNAGTFRKTIGTGTTGLGLRFTNTGVVDVQTGTLRFTSTAPNTNTFSGNFNIAAGAFVEFASSSGGFNFNPGATFTGDGEFRVNFGAAITVNNFALPIRNFVLDGGNVNSGGVNSAFNISGSNSRFNDGNFFVPRLINLNGANTRFGGANFTFLGTRLENQGTARFQQNVVFNNGSSLFNFGTMEAAHNTSLRQQAGAAFNFSNLGNLFPGQPIGTLFMDGNFVQSPTGVMNIDIGGTTPGTQFDQLRIFPGVAGGTGTGTLGGVLNVNLVNGFVPASNQFFQIMTCQNGCSGQFIQINGVNIAANRVLVPGYGTNAVSLITTAVSASINPPVLQAAKTGNQNSFVFGRYTGAPNTQYLISFYRGCDATNSNFGTKLITTDANGNATYQANFPFPLALGSFVSARATDANNLTSNLSNCLQVRRGLLFDRDGDGIDDIGVFRPSQGTWYIQESSSGLSEAFSAIQFGIAGDKIVPGDYDGDLRSDLAVYRPSTGVWYVLNSSNGSVTIVQFGISEDIPVASDYDGDGKTDIVVFRPSTGVWYGINSSNGGINITQFGLNGDKPVAGDYDGDGRSDIAVWRPSDRVWYLLRSTQGFAATQFGLSSDFPTQSDYDGDGKTDIGVYRPSQGIWYVLGSTNGFSATQFGIAEDLPAPGDYDGDGRADIGVFRPSSGIWYLLRSTQGFFAVPFGLNGDKPIAGGYIPSVP